MPASFSRSLQVFGASKLFEWNWEVPQFHKRLCSLYNYASSGSAHRCVAVPSLADEWKMKEVAYDS
jgi:hypothetical protein